MLWTERNYQRVDSSCKFPLLVCRRRRCRTQSQLQGQIGKVFIEVLVFDT